MRDAKYTSIGSICLFMCMCVCVKKIGEGVIEALYIRKKESIYTMENKEDEAAVN